MCCGSETVATLPLDPFWMAIQSLAVAVLGMKILESGPCVQQDTTVIEKYIKGKCLLYIIQLRFSTGFSLCYGILIVLYSHLSILNTFKPSKKTTTTTFLRHLNVSQFLVPRCLQKSSVFRTYSAEQDQTRSTHNFLTRSIARILWKFTPMPITGRMRG